MSSDTNPAARRIVVDDELAAMADCGRILEKLDGPETDRVLIYLAAKFGDNVNISGKISGDSEA